MKSLVENFVIIVEVLFFIYFLYVLFLVPKRKARLRDEKTLLDFKAEVERISALPKLRTGLLVRVPSDYAQSTSIHNRIYATHYNRILVFDEKCCGWVGLITPQIIEDLMAGEFLLCKHHVPFRGDGEGCYGKPVMFNNLRIDTYPMWLSEGDDFLEWSLWEKVERNFNEVLRTEWHWLNALQQLNEKQFEFSNKRERFNDLALAAKKILQK